MDINRCLLPPQLLREVRKVLSVVCELCGLIAQLIDFLTTLVHGLEALAYRTLRTCHAACCSATVTL